MEEVANAIRALEGAVNAQIEQIKQINRRLDKLENPTVHITATTLALPRTEQDLKDISKLPDSVKELQNFEGDPTQYVSWVHNVENILRDYEIMSDKPIYRAILQSVRQKIRGNANSALISYNIFDNDWMAIKKCLSLHYADKRDLRTLEHQLGNLIQRNMSLDEFYANVNHQFSLIVNKIKTEDYKPEAINVLVETYRNRALDVFIRGLNGDLPKMLMIQRPQTLPEAYASCLEMQNLNFRNIPIHSRNYNNSVTAPVNQILPRLRYQSQRNPNPMSVPQRNMAYNIQHQSNPNMAYSIQQQNYSAPPRPINLKPPVPMSIDPSVQTKQVNYINRPNYPNNQTFKREISNHNEPRKLQRLHHMETQQEDEDHYNELVEDYLENEVNDEEQPEENPEINFMMEASLAFHT